MTGFFSLDTARAVFDKAAREYERLRATPSTDNVFNFFVTAYHVGDYLRADNQVAPDEIKALLNEPDMQRCAHVCNQGKHAVLTQREFKNRPSPVAAVESGAIGMSAINSHAINGAPPISLYYPDTQERVDILPLADRVMDRLAQFFADHKL